MSTSSGASTTGTLTATSVQKVTLVISVIFLVVGIAGFIPGITTNYDQLLLAGHESEALLLGVFQVSILHNLVHLLYGVVGIVLARTAIGARNYLIWGGVIYLVLWLYGLFIDQESAVNFVPLNSADNWLHLVLGLGMVVLGVVFGRTRATATSDTL
ncbi:DUF4383 domain-containing protein [Cryobacterium sp. W22_MBD10_FK3]|uniref:DUF4383 domain-containing protein n=1 Tax=Cryobacterium sp. W22_MBD10_FK3 TaxID=3240273 RepID=UPI003F92E2FC